MLHMVVLTSVVVVVNAEDFTTVEADARRGVVADACIYISERPSLPSFFSIRMHE
jgi:hypothetical protein